MMPKMDIKRKAKFVQRMVFRYIYLQCFLFGAQAGKLKCMHRCLDILPDVLCRSPKESLEIFEENPPNGNIYIIQQLSMFQYTIFLMIEMFILS